MKAGLLASVMLALVVAACGEIPYRKAGFEQYPECRAIYDRHDDITPGNKNVTDADRGSRCWLRSHEERNEYDLLTVEFDDQGWVQGSSDLGRPAKSDYLDQFFRQLEQIYRANQKNGLSLVLFIHGWHHNADARDKNVTEFRLLLRDLAIFEGGRPLSERNAEGSGPRAVGIYVGWRGESITVPIVNTVTFWERKNTAERVAQGSVRELFARLDFFRDGARADGKRNVRLLTIGHSFGGLVTFEALSSDFLRAAVRSGSGYVSRVGDVVVIVNPAIEGARYEPLMVAGQRMSGLKDNQLPVVILATSTADSATGFFFPLARNVSTLLESTPGPEGDSIVKAVGHNERYITHKLSLCEKEDKDCAAACPAPRTKQRQSVKALSSTDQDDYSSKLRQDMAAEVALMRVIGDKGFKGRRYLCSGMRLEPTANQVPEQNPFWVVSTTGDIMSGHNDIFNPKFVSFIRQMYLGFITERSK
jgi:hypothetical protein